MTEAKLVIKGLSYQAGKQSILNNINLMLKPGKLQVILGPNGAGKSSLLRCALGLNTAHQGEVTLSGQAPAKLSPQQRARIVSYLPQNRPMAWPITVRDTISLGRFSHGVNLGQLSAIDEQHVNTALTNCDLNHLAERSVNTLSGGELARVHCARAFAAHTPLLIADEPTAALDPKHRFSIMELMRQYVDQGNGALLVLHDIELAARFADKLIWLRDGKIVSEGSPEETLSEALMLEVYGVKSAITQHQGFQSVSILGSADKSDAPKLG